jgi:ribosomal protein S18 acetylase RimI-like enzyme
MVARPPLRLIVEPMRLDDLPAVHAIELASFTAPWPPHAYRSELESNKLAHPAWRRQRIGERLLLAFLDIAVDQGAHEATLEVRLSNLAARKLYEKYGFRPVGLRPRYYSDDGEDALIMTTEPLDGRAMRERLARLRAGLEASGVPATESGAPSDVPPGIEPEGPR